MRWSRYPTAIPIATPPVLGVKFFDDSSTEKNMEIRSLRNKAALVTGARRGIGKAIACALAAAGADVAVCDVVAEDGLLHSTKSELEKLGSKSIAIAADISRRDDVSDMAQQALKEYGKIDILVNCAGIWIPGQTLIECSDENWDRVIDTNLKGTYLCCQAVGKIMIGQKSGSIINMSSEVGLTPGAGAGAYSISKAGIIMLTRQLALELAIHRIRVNALAPGIVKTDFNAEFWKEPSVEKQTAGMVPLGRLAEPEEVAQAAAFLASDAASYVTGEVICINGGWHPSNNLAQ
jgi:NAD(P)-dependent dehydrogenase (short-subunit alcohol dehydrogenase family)